jgi:glucosamine-6-phosphate deaminase
MKTLTKDKLTVKIMPTRQEMGRVAACDIAECIKSYLSRADEINMIFAAAPSQNEVLASLLSDTEIEWNRINAFHMDEYIGLPKDAPQGFGNFLVDRLFGRVPFKSVNLIRSDATDAETECERYSGLLREHPCHICVMGIGENGHIAFNDPPVADFCDKALVKAVELDSVCRNQQVHDGCFATLDEVPTHALTLTCPTLAAAEYKFCIVPAKTKANAVSRMLKGDISEECPATVLRRCDNAVMYLDADSSALL